MLSEKGGSAASGTYSYNYSSQHPAAVNPNTHSGVSSPVLLSPLGASYSRLSAAHVTLIMGWAAWQLEPSRWTTPTYHLFLADQEMSACRRIRVEDTITPFYDNVPADGHGCRECVRNMDRAPISHRKADRLIAVETPLFAKRLVARHIPVRQM